MAVKEIATRLGRKPQSVGHKLMRLNAGVVPAKRGWSKVEDRRLGRLWHMGSWDALDRAFPGRSRDSIHVRAGVLGLRRERLALSESELANIAALTEAEIAYIAGLFDGEGSISRSDRWYRLSLALTYEPTIRWLEEKVGGAVHHYDRTAINPNHSPIWAWRLTKSRAIAALLRRMQPYLQVKAERVAAALEKLPA